MPNIVPFNEIEAIILLSVCRFILNNRMNKNSMLMCLSNILRSYSLSKGNSIDSSFRSTSGLMYQTNVMLKYISTDDETIKVPRIFKVVVELQKNSPLKYERDLWEGLTMSSDNNKQAFLRFLTLRRPQSVSDIFWALEKAENHLKSCGVLSGSMYEGLSFEKLQHFESFTLKNNTFIRKNSGMLHSLKIGFSLLKEYVKTDAAADSKQGKIQLDTKEISNSTSSKQSQTTEKTASVTGNVSFEFKTETLEKLQISANSVPVSFTYYNRAVGDLKSWQDLYVRFMKIFWTEKGRQLSPYMGKSLVDAQFIDICDSNTTKRMRKPKRIANNVFIETDLTYREILVRIKIVLDKTSIPTKRFSITYKQPVADGSEVVTANAKSDQNADSISDVSAGNSAKTNTLHKFKQDKIEKEINPQVFKIDFYQKRDMAYTMPVKCSCEDIEIYTLRSWTDLYVTLFTALWNKYRDKLSYYVGKNLAGGLREDICVGSVGDRMIAPKLIEKDANGNSVYLETNMSANNIIGRIKNILEICHIPFTDVQITYIKKGNVSTRVVDKPQKSSERVASTEASNNYTEWLIRKYKLSDVTAKNYSSLVRRAEKIAKEQGLSSQRILTASSYEEAQATYSELLNNSKFISLNESAHNGFTAAINKYLQYLLTGGADSNNSLPQPIKSKYDKELVERCLTVLEETFSNGIKRNAGIAKRKFRNAYSDKYGMDFPEDADLDELLNENAVEYDGKFYAASSELISFIKELLQNYPVGSDMLLFYDTLYDKNITKFSQYGVYSSDMLKTVLERNFSDYYYKLNYFSTRRGLSLDQVINIAYGENVFLTISELQERLPYISEGPIIALLSRSNSGFVRIKDGTYAMESRIHIAESDIERSRKIIENDLSKQGYSFVKSIIVEESENLNPEIPEQALQLVLFDHYLSNFYSRNRKTISPLGESESIVNVLINFCRQHKKITLKEAQEYEMEYTGENSARRSLKVLTENMIRVSNDTFVDQIDFDVVATDKAIEPFFNHRKVISLKNITSFSVFPDIEEYAWNSYLLSSYLRHYSERWSFIGEEHKKKSIGAIFDKSLTFDSYNDAIARAVADSGIKLTQEEVSYFLLHNEYRLRDADFKDVISKAYQIRMREE